MDISRVLTLFFVLLFWPGLAYADTGGAILPLSILAFCILGSIIGVLEGLVIVRLFKTKVKRSIFVMIFANCFSMGIGYLILAASFSWLDLHSPAFSAKLWSSSKILLEIYFWSYLLSILLELPFCFKLLKEEGRTFRDSFYASLAAQTASYALIIAPIYFYLYRISTR